MQHTISKEFIFQLFENKTILSIDNSLQTLKRINPH